jgi:hypothetical protein
LVSPFHGIFSYPFYILGSKKQGITPARPGMNSCGKYRKNRRFVQGGGRWAGDRGSGVGGRGKEGRGARHRFTAYV